MLLNMAAEETAAATEETMTAKPRKEGITEDTSVLVGQQSARFYQVVNAFPFVRNLHRAEQHELFVLRQ